VLETAWYSSLHDLKAIDMQHELGEGVDIREGIRRLDARTGNSGLPRCRTNLAPLLRSVSSALSMRILEGCSFPRVDEEVGIRCLTG